MSVWIVQLLLTSFDLPVRSTEVSIETTNAILEGCKSLAPELLTKDGSFEVLSVQCGFRPTRENGPRVQAGTDGMFNIVHSYGHAGAG